MDINFKEIMSKHSDDTLIRIVTSERDDYKPQAIEAAENEIEKRGIDQTTFEEVKNHFTAKVETQKRVEERHVTAATRLLNFIFDTILILLITLIISSILELFIKLRDEFIIALFANITFAISFLGYYIFMETKYQKTVGKFLTKTVVVTKDGERPKNGDIVRRTFCRLIPLDRLSFLFTDNGFHDRFSYTRVVNDVELKDGN